MMQRLSIEVRGLVQGVGYRPFVYGLARQLALAGFVRNDAGMVRIEVEGASERLDEFLTRLRASAPPLARVEHVDWRGCAPLGEADFRIDTSGHADSGAIHISPDVATCDECLRELFDSSDRRYRYAFINCTNCGPRLTIITGAPYDRPQTTMAGFAMCEACRREYDNPHDRRFHAQPIACPECGPRLTLRNSRGEPVGTADPIAGFAVAMREGKVGAIKGLGGYHLACDAQNAAAVALLRQRKRRDEKPLAIMCRDVEAVRQQCHVFDSELELLTSRRRPIVLLRRLEQSSVAAAVAPENPLLGVMLPYTPVHHLLLREFDGPLVMTSGNLSDEPIAYEDADAASRLAEIADVLLTHDRAIHVRCDDSVTRVVAGAELPMRRSRGYAPQPVDLPIACPAPMLATGGQLKATFALARDRLAVLSHHLGDLDHYSAYRAFLRDIKLYEELFEFAPRLIVHDLHPDYASTRYAGKRAAETGVPTLAVQHHHAHLASCMAENGLLEPVIGVTFDGTGYGLDGAIWGGEFLVGDYRSFRRAAHLRYVALPGGDAAIKEPWRVALAQLLDASSPTTALERRIGAPLLEFAGRMIERRLNSPMTSSMGRLFDAAACLAGVRDRVRYEGQAAIEFERLAIDQPESGKYPVEWNELQGATEIDTRPLIRAMIEDLNTGTASALIARRFHSTIVAMVTQTCSRIAGQSGIDRVMLSGGVFLNSLLTEEVCAALGAVGLRPYRHRLVPPGDGGISLGQIAVAAATWSAS